MSLHAKFVWTFQIMATRPVNSTPDSLKWKQLFESALDELSDDTKRDRSKPIYSRRPVVFGAEPEYKRTDRVLSDAADALAALWRTPSSKAAPRPGVDRNPK
jgi:hypothetical protein